MTEAKAKLYRTARIAEDFFGADIEAYGLVAGQFVSVKHTGKGSFGGFNFLVNDTLVLNEMYLTDFVL
jgi:hypothetical protein